MHGADNTGIGLGGRQSTPQLEMQAFDGLPPVVRRALAFAWFNWSSEDVAEMLADASPERIARHVDRGDASMSRRYPPVPRCRRRSPS